MPNTKPAGKKGKSVDIHEGELWKIIQATWDRCKREASGDENQRRSRKWVDGLAEEFNKKFRKDLTQSNDIVFWQGNDGNKAEFGLNELLFDILVCQTETTWSMESKPKPLNFVSEASWIVESEFAENTRHILLDMSKLVLGTASNKLFIVSDRNDENEKLLDRLKPVAKKIDGRLFLAFVPHPRHWSKDCHMCPVLYRWESGKFDCVKYRE